MNHDGLLDILDWRGQMPELGIHGALQHIKDVIYKNSLRSDDIVKKMKLIRNQAALNVDELGRALGRLDLNLNPKKAQLLAYSILKNRPKIPVTELLTLLETVEDE